MEEHWVHVLGFGKPKIEQESSPWNRYEEIEKAMIVPGIETAKIRRFVFVVKILKPYFQPNPLGRVTICKWRDMGFDSSPLTQAFLVG